MNPLHFASSTELEDFLVEMVKIKKNGPELKCGGICANTSNRYVNILHAIIQQWPKRTKHRMFPIPLSRNQKLQFWKYWFSPIKGYFKDDKKWENPLRVELLDFIIETVRQELISRHDLEVIKELELWDV